MNQKDARAFDYFIKYKKGNNSKIKLVLMGKNVIEIPQQADIIPLGFVSDEDKFDGIAASKLLIMPSKYESLSMSVLESLKLGRPILVNGQCEVLKGHCIKSSAGLYYENYYEFKECLDIYAIDEMLLLSMRRNAIMYIDKLYKWETIISTFTELLQSIRGPL